MGFVRNVLIFASCILVTLVQTSFGQKPEVEVVPAIYAKGQEVQLICSVPVGQGDPPPLTWTLPDPKQANRLKISNSTSKNENGKRFVVAATIPQVNDSDEGEYVCTSGEHRVSYRLKYEAAYDIKFSLRGHKSTEVTVSPSKPAELIVDFYSYPPPAKIEWKHNFKIVQNNSNGVSFYNEATKSRLVISEPSLESSGLYALEVDNSATATHINITVHVQDGTSPEVQIQEAEMFYLIGKEYKVVCDIRAAAPVETVRWFLTPCEYPPDCGDSQRTELPKEQFSESRGEGPHTTQSTLRITSTQSALLSCVACSGSSCGSANHTFIATDIAEEGGDMQVEGPEEVLLGDNVTIRCSASKYHHTDRFQWTHANTEKAIGDTERVSGNDTKLSYISVLRIPHVTLADNGDYTCHTTHRIGSEQPSVQVYQLNALRGEKASIDKPVKNSYNVMPEERVVLNCVARGVPTPQVTWSKGRLGEKELAKLKWEKLENNTLTKVVYSGERDGGIYRCEAKNRIGEAAFVEYKVILPGNLTKTFCEQKGYYPSHNPNSKVNSQINFNVSEGYRRADAQNRQARSVAAAQQISNMALAAKKNRFFAQARRELKQLRFPPWFLLKVKEGLGKMISDSLREYKLEYDCYKLAEQLHHESSRSLHPSVTLA